MSQSVPDSRDVLNVMFCDSNSTAQLFTLEFKVFFSRISLVGGGRS